jgi:hypothetical protein
LHCQGCVADRKIRMIQSRVNMDFLTEYEYKYIRNVKHQISDICIRISSILRQTIEYQNIFEYSPFTKNNF